MKSKILRTLVGMVVVGTILLMVGCGTPTVTVGTPARERRSVLTIGGTPGTSVHCTSRVEATSYDLQAVLPMRVVFDHTITRELEVRKRSVGAELVVELHDPDARPIRFVAKPGSNGVSLVHALSPTKKVCHLRG